ncbi:MAG: VacJ family lipoprotein [Burkholderiales bacterium]|nr:VacJ family lipoprotein [Burkholderiales bacterium]
MKSAAAALALAALLAGCASVPSGAPSAPQAANPVDPWEHWNRKVFAFNDALDDAVLKPVAQGYQKAVPKLVRKGVDNVFGNIGDAWSALNQFLQGKMQYGLEMGMRVVTNTVFGLGGLLDPASEMRLTRRSEDFGLTLGHWGVGPGPYVVLPIIGPSTLRDTTGWVVDRYAAAPSKIATQPEGQYAIDGLQLVNTRANLLATTNLVGQVALDRYSFIRDGYLAHRLDQVWDGNPPLQNMDDDSADAPAAK